MAEERFVSTIFYSIAQWANVRYGYIHVVWIESAVKHRCLSALADTGGNPFTGIDFLENLKDGMEIVCATFCSQVLPVSWLGCRFQKVAVFYKYHVGVEHSGKFFAISWREGITGSITFGHDNSWAVEAYM